MNPRLVGALLVLTVVAVMVSVPAFTGRRTAGNAVMVELPRDPQVGDCLLDLPVELAALSVQWRAPAAGSPTPAAELPDVSTDPFGPRFVPCDGGPVAGEVVAVAAAVADPGSSRLRAPIGLDCRSAALSYGGLAILDGRFVVRDSPADDPVTWNLSVNIRSSWVMPSMLLQAQHRRWAACVVAPRDDVRYTGRFADAFNGGVLPDEYGTCWNDRTVSAAFKRVDCRAPHLAELISAGRILDRARTTNAQLQDSCEQLAARVVGRPDPTAGARLVVKTSPERLAENSAATTASVLCYLITPDRPLAATLVGLGEQPIPYAG